MADRRRSRQLSSVFFDALELTWKRQVDLENARGPFSGQAVDVLRPCAGTKGQTCQIALNLSAWNEFLCHAGLEIRYLSEGNGQLCLFTFSALPPVIRDEPDAALQVAALLRLLFKKHCCVTSVCANLNELKVPEEVLFDALQGNTCLKKLVLDTSFGDMPEAACTTIATLTALEELECKTEECSPEFSSALSTLLGMAPLTALRIPELEMDETAKKEFLEALKHNTTLKEISVHESVFKEDCGKAFTEYLKRSPMLTKLSIVASSQLEGQRCLNILLLGLLENTTITTLTLRGFSFNWPDNVMSFERVLSENRSIRALHIVDNPVTEIYPTESSCDTWLAAIAGNDALEELTLPLHIWTTNVWERFFDVLERMVNLRTVTMQKADPDMSNCQWVHKVLRESGLRQKVSLKTCRVLDYFEQLECGLAFEEPAFKYRLMDVTALGTMPSADQVTALSLNIRRGDLAVSSALASYINGASVLQFLSLCIESEVQITSSANAWWTLILESLSINKAIRKLRLICVTFLKASELESLAEMVRGSRSVRQIAIFDVSSAFTRRLADGIQENRCLQSAILCDDSFKEAKECWFAVRDVAQRNSDLLVRAALFVYGSRFDRRHAAALEEVARHRFLVKSMAELASIKEDDVGAAVRGALNTIESMDSFFRLAGVVKEQVVCYPPGDERMQLSDLPEDCWRHVRQHLTLSDVEEVSLLQ